MICFIYIHYKIILINIFLLAISFGQSMRKKDMDRAGAEARACELFIVVGSSLVVYPAAGFPIAAKDQGAKLVIINRDATELDHIADLVINAEIGPTLSALIDCRPGQYPI